MTTLRTDKGRTGFQFVVVQIYFSSPHCPENPWFPRPTQTSFESVLGSFRKDNGFIPKGYGAHSESVRGSFRKVTNSFWKSTGLMPKGKYKEGMKLIIYHSSEKKSGTRGVPTHLPHVFVPFSLIE